MIEWIVEYEEYWFDCNVTYYEQTLNIKADTKEEATEVGKKILTSMDSNDNNSTGPSWSDFNPMVSRSFYRCVKLDEHVYNSSMK